jgi:hypothetical protein
VSKYPDLDRWFAEGGPYLGEHYFHGRLSCHEEGAFLDLYFQLALRI